jgi:hypothetical protein
MTRSKLDLATILVKLRGDNSDPEKLAKELSLVKLCYEIQKIEEEREAAAAEGEKAAPVEEPLTKAEEEIVEEVRAEPEPGKKKNKHILSWLLDSSSDEEL